MLANTDNTKQQSKEEAVYVGNQTETETLLNAAGDFDGGTLSFQAQTIIVDNFSSVYVYIQDARRYALPNVSNQVFPANRVTNKRIRWQAPAGIKQPADNGSPVIVTWNSELLLVGGPGANAQAVALTAYEQAIPATANNGLLSVGPGPWDGASAGKFAGNGSGTIIAANAPNTFTGNLADLQRNGVSLFLVDPNGTVRLINNGRGFHYNDAGGLQGRLVAFSDSSATIVGIIRAAVTQTGDLQQYQKSDGTTLSNVRGDGLITSPVNGLASKVKAGAPVDADWSVAPPDATLVVDSTNNKLWARVGGVWKGVVIA